MYLLFFLFWLLSSAKAFETQELDDFLGDLIDTWQLRSPTIIIQGDLPDFCMRAQWLLCLSEGLNTSEVANHLDLIHQHRQQDGIILFRRTGHDQLLTSQIGFQYNPV